MEDDETVYRCPRCGVELDGESRRHGGRPRRRDDCPYTGLPYADLRAAHDAIYFGAWRRMDASPLDILRAYRRIDAHIEAVRGTLAGRELPSASRDLALAAEAHRAADPEGGSKDALRFMDDALSYAHRSIDGLLREAGAPPHRPMDFSEWHDAVEVPFRDEW